MKLLIPGACLALFLYLCWLAWPYHLATHSYDVEGLNELTGRVTQSHARPLARHAGASSGRTPDFESGNAGSSPAPATIIADLWHVSDAELDKPVNIFGEE